MKGIKMKLIHLLLTIALIVPFMGCDSITLDDPKVATLEEEMKVLTTQYNDLVTMNRALIAEKKDLTDRLAMAAVVIEEQDRKIAVLNIERGLAVDTIDAIMDFVAETEKELVNVEKASSWPPSKGDRIAFEIAFDNNQLYNREDSREAARMIKAYNEANNGNIKITIEGYSSKSGSAELNKALSLERAEGVMFKIYEAFNSADPLNMEVIAHGETDDDERKVVITVEVI
jgi:outer membrane protein OmpA-like peptidoglycan-associated protein